MVISQKLRDLIRSAWDDGYPCLLATEGPDGPNISPKGSMVVFDDEHLAYWERSKRQALALGRMPLSGPAPGTSAFTSGAAARRSSARMRASNSRRLTGLNR